MSLVFLNLMTLDEYIGGILILKSLTKKEEYQEYIRSVWSPYNTYMDVEYLAVIMGVSLDYLKSLLKEMNLTYLSKNDMNRLSREKYLCDVWCNQSLKTRLSLDELANVLHTSLETIHKDIKRLGLEEYVLSSSDLLNNQQDYDDYDYKLNQAYQEYEKSGKQYIYEELALKLNLPLPYIKVEVDNKRLNSMIKPYSETIPKYKRMSYYKINSDMFKNHFNLLYISSKFCIPLRQVKLELIESGVVISLNLLDSDILCHF